MTRQRPRHFLYLDSDETGSYVSDLLGGLPEGTSYTDRSDSEQRRGWNVGYRGTGVQRGKGEGSSSEDGASFVHTPRSLFRLLYEELAKEVDEEKILVQLNSLNRESWEGLENGDIVEMAGVLKVPEEVKAIEMARGLEKARPILEAFGEDLGMSPEDERMLNALGGLQDLGTSAGTQNAAVVIVELAASPRYRFVAKLKHQFIEVDQEDLEGEATVLGIVQRKLNRDDSPIGVEQLIPGLEKFRSIVPKMSRAERRAAKNHKRGQEAEGTSVGYPGATLTPIAIYR